MKFVNRESELKALDDFWEKKTSQLIVIYGKRRVGKTELIKQFIRSKPAIYFLADKLPERENLKILTRIVGEFFKDEFIIQREFADWYQFFTYLKRMVKKPLVLVIDEFSYLAEVNKAISSVFQKGWDEYLQTLPIFLILCGSSISMMEMETLAYKAPLYGRRTGQIFVRPLPFLEASNFFPNSYFERRLEFFSIAGGTPAYLQQLDGDKSARNNVMEEILSPERLLHREVEFVLREELREPRNYLNILKAIAYGRHKFGEIVNETGMEKGVIHKYLFILEDLHLIRKGVPVTEKNPLRSRKGRYYLNDQFFEFWFTYVLPFKSELELGNNTPSLRKLDSSFNLLVARNYEVAAQEILRKHSSDFFPLMRMGKWWDKAEEIDLVALNDDTNQILFGEVKWSNKPVGTNIYEDLKRKSALVKWGKPNRQEYFCLFSKSGFTPAMKKLVKKEKVILFHEDHLIKV